MPFGFFYLTVLITVSHYCTSFDFHFRRKWSIVLRTQLSVRVNACIGKANGDAGRANALVSSRQTAELGWTGTTSIAVLPEADLSGNAPMDESIAGTVVLVSVQDDKDLVHEFVNNQGLQCLVKIGGAADQNYQNYILRGRSSCFSSRSLKRVDFL